MKLRLAILASATALALASGATPNWGMAQTYNPVFGSNNGKAPVPASWAYSFDSNGNSVAVYQGGVAIPSYGYFSAPGLVTNADLVSPTITVNGYACTLGGSCTISSGAAISITAGTTGVAGGVSNGLLYDNGGVLGNLNTLANGVLTTNSSGVPGVATTLPTGLNLQTPTAIGLANGTGLPISTGVSGLGTGVATALAAGINTTGGFITGGSASGFCALGGCQFTGGVGFAGTNLSQSSALVVNNVAGGNYGGVWYMSNPSSGATNGAKYFRLDPTGNLQITNATNSATLFQLSDAGILSLYNSAFVVMPQTDGNRFEVDRDASAVSYAGTRAAFVVQQRDAESLSSNQTVPGAVFQFNVTGNGVVSLPSTSASIWWGLLSSMNKSGDGSGQTFTMASSLGAIGPTGYNELGGFEGTLTNTGSTNGYISGYEVEELDGGFDTHMDNVVSRIARTVAGTKPVRNFVATSEGNAAPDAILQTLNAGYNTWKEGFDISGATLTSGIAAAFPNNTSVQFLSAGGVAASALLVSNANITWLTPVTSAGQACIGTSAFAKVFCEASSKAVVVSHLEFAGSLASATAGTGATFVGDDNAGRVTVGTSPGTTVAIAFSNSPAAWTNAPICLAQDETTAVTLRATTVATTGVTFTASGTLGAGDKVSYFCTGYQ